MPSIVLLGDINIDLLLLVPAYPDEGGEAIARNQVQKLGGSAVNTAISLTRLGCAAQMIGRTGDDNFGRLALDELGRAKVGTDWVTQDQEEPTQLNLVIVSSAGERTMFAYRGANVRLAPEHIDEKMLHGADLLHISGYSFLQAPQSAAAQQAIALANAAGIPVTLDIPAGIAADIAIPVYRCAPQFDTIMMGPSDGARLGLNGPNDLLALGVPNLVLKYGQQGCTYMSAQGAVAIEGIGVETVDTTGAGDALAAGYIAGYVSGLDGKDSAVLGNLMGACAVGQAGGGMSMPGAGEVLALIERRNLADRVGETLIAWLKNIAIDAPA